MGGFYGSVQVRTEDRLRVRQVAEDVARARGVRCLLGPALGGWVGVYPQNGGQDQSVGEEIAKRLDCEVLHLLVHDDDIMAYWLWRGGELVDSYWSTPGYFDEEQREEQEAMAGRPEVFGPLLRKGTSPLEELLRRDRRFTFEMERLQEFAGLLGIANAVTSYEYLKEGETDGIRGWKQFEELPGDDVVREKQTARERRKQLNALKKELNLSGQLLAEKTAKDDIYRGCTVENGFVVVGSGVWPFTVAPAAEWHSSPWKTATPLSLDLSPHVNRLVQDSTSRRMAAALGNRCVVWDTRTWHLLRDVPESDGARGVALSDDGRRLAHSSRIEVVITDVDSGSRIASLPCDSERAMAFHPSGRYLVASLHSGLGIAEIDQQGHPQWRKFLVGGNRVFLSEGMKQRYAGATPEEVEQGEIARNEAILAATERRLAVVGKGLSPEQRARLLETTETILKKALSEFHSHLAGASPKPQMPSETVATLRFVRDGRHLCLGTNQGFRVYSWAAVLETDGNEMPPPVWRFDLSGTDETGIPHGYVYAIEQEANGSGVVFGGITGQLFRMDLESGEVRSLLSTPDQGWIIDVLLSRDGQALGIVSRTPPERGSRRGSGANGCTWSVWSYPKLLAGTAAP